MTSAGFTNVSVQKFASEGDMALFERNWDEHSELVLKKLGQRGLLSFTAHKIVNQDQDLTRMYIFEQESAEAVQACPPIWKELETALFGNIVMKLTAYRGVQSARWTRDQENFMSQTETKKVLGKMGLYLVSTKQKPGIKWPTRPKDALPDEGHYN